MNASAFAEKIQTQGFAIVPGVLAPDTVGRLKMALERAIAQESEDHRYHGRHALADVSMVLLCALYGSEFVNTFEISSLMEPFEWILGEGCIVYAYTSSSMPPCASNHSTRIHVDCPRLIDGYLTNMGATILLDDFTPENGATWFLLREPHARDCPISRRVLQQWTKSSRPCGFGFLFQCPALARGRLKCYECMASRSHDQHVPALYETENRYPPGLLEGIPRHPAGESGKRFKSWDSYRKSPRATTNITCQQSSESSNKRRNNDQGSG